MTGQSNGTPEPSRILSLEDKRAAMPRKGNDFITVQQAYDMVIQECAKVHEHYLTQIPNFTARMIQDALLSYGLIKPMEGVDIVPDSVASGIGNDNTEGPQHEDAVPSSRAGPSDNIKAEEPAVQVSGDAESTPAPVAQS